MPNWVAAFVQINRQQTKSKNVREAHFSECVSVYFFHLKLEISFEKLFSLLFLCLFQWFISSVLAKRNFFFRLHFWWIPWLLRNMSVQSLCQTHIAILLIFCLVLFSFNWFYPCRLRNQFTFYIVTARDGVVCVCVCVCANGKKFLTSWWTAKDNRIKNEPARVWFIKTNFSNNLQDWKDWNVLRKANKCQFFVFAFFFLP